MPDRPIAYILRKRLAANLSTTRKSRKWTQEDLAEAAGMSRTYISEVERLDRNITLDVLERLADAFGIDAIELLK